MNRGFYAGVFAVTFATLAHELLLTRIFSVTMFYHFAFVAVSVAMFGLATAGVLVYGFPQKFPKGKTRGAMSVSALLFAFSMVVSLVIELAIPFRPEKPWLPVSTYIVASVPFVFSGLVICLALTRYPRFTGFVYAADLCGSAAGCIGVILLLKLTDGPTAILLNSFIASLGALLLARESAGRLRPVAGIIALVLGLLAGTHALLAAKQESIVRVAYNKKGVKVSRPLWETWNSYSRVAVWGDLDKATELLPANRTGPGYSPDLPDSIPAKILFLNIDSNAGTVLTAFHGDLRDVDYLKYDIVNLVHYLRPRSKTLVVGVGGGRDILSALLFGAKEILGVEINGQIVDALTGRFGDFTGHLDRYRGVSLVVDEARSYITRSQDRFDVIQVSFVDTWAATAAGAFVLTENALYTVEAWKTLLDHLAPTGIVTFSRWYREKNPGEIYRSCALAAASLRERGVTDPRRHIILARRRSTSPTPGVGTILVSPSPFSKEDVELARAITRKLKFDLVLSPQESLDPVLPRMIEAKDLDAFAESFPINIAPPRDDSPFFFNMLRLRDLADRRLWRELEDNPNLKAVFMLGMLLLTVTGLTVGCIVVPLLWKTGREELRGSLRLSIFFLSIGLGFMQVEISQMQRLIVFLGHPTYGLSVVLFSLLLAAGLGSYLTDRFSGEKPVRMALVCLAFLLLLLTLFGLLTPGLLHRFRSAVTPIRILVAISTLFPLGVLMGTAFPFGMKLAYRRTRNLTPWLWGLNGAASVLGSVLAIAIALSSSISATFFTGVTCYLIAALAYLRAATARPAEAAN